jgi:hypothetical protein
MYSKSELCLLGQAYTAGKGLSAATLSRYVVGNTKLFPRLLAGMDCTARSAEAASIWFDMNWPAEIAWPQGVRPRGTALAAVQPRGEIETSNETGEPMPKGKRTPKAGNKARTTATL